MEVFNARVQRLEGGMLPTQMTETSIVLIPKVDFPKYMKDLRHISLCNVLYKIIAKVLAKRFKVILPKCIAQEQPAFIES